jgi:hypothetical protein
MASGNFVISATFAGSVTQTNGYWTSTPNYANNTSSIVVEYYVTKASGFTSTFGTGTFGITVDGETFQTTKSITVPGGSTVLVFTTPAKTITHNTNGTKSIAISVFGDIPSTTWTSTTGTTTAVLDNIVRWQTDTTLDPATRGTAVSRTVTATNATSYSLQSSSGGTGTYSVSSSGVISGTPSATGTASLVVRATNSGGSLDRTFTMVVNPALPVFSDTTLAAGNVSFAYSDGVSASEAASYSVRNTENTAAGTLPLGLSLNTTTGAITGTPTTAGSTQFRIRATNVTGSTDTSILTIRIFGGAKMWNGTSFANVEPRIWNGTSYVSAVPRIWNGTDWVLM